MSEEQLVFAYYNGTLFSFERASRYSASEFGGPINVKLSGVEHGPKPLHLIAELAATDLCPKPPGAGDRDKLFNIPLIYGMCFDGCNIDYHVDIKGNIEIRKMRPTESSDDWPYRNYPLLLPYLPLRVGETRNCSYAEFAEPVLQYAGAANDGLGGGGTNASDAGRFAVGQRGR